MQASLKEFRPIRVMDCARRHAGYRTRGFRSQVPKSLMTSRIFAAESKAGRSILLLPGLVIQTNLRSTFCLLSLPSILAFRTLYVYPPTKSVAVFPGLDVSQQ